MLPRLGLPDHFQKGLRVFDLPRWALAFADDDFGGIEVLEVKPVLNRDGYYAVRGVAAWVEVAGKAYHLPSTQLEMVKFDLGLHLTPWLRENEEGALRLLVRERLASRKQIEMLHMIGHRRYIREIRRGIRTRSIAGRRRQAQARNNG